MHIYTPMGLKAHINQHNTSYKNSNKRTKQYIHICIFHAVVESNLLSDHDFLTNEAAYCIIDRQERHKTNLSELSILSISE